VTALALFLASPAAAYLTGQEFVIDGGASAADVTALALFLASPAAAYLTGQEFVIDGGASAAGVFTVEVLRRAGT
ncbi:MAG TPA: hypothetical protein DCY80_18190, partial [Solibacterales bacterium]|nr:hypothetical protein [Bryobacterales bacterium]